MNKQDANADVIVSALRAAGCIVRFVQFTYASGCPDLLVGFRGMTYLLEVKGPRGRLSKEQAEFIAEWAGGPVAVVRTVDEALAAVGLTAAQI